jgi:glycosyltransferase involved in cell wall biosynthesis
MNHNGHPTISVMMPCYNNSKFIEQAVRSVLDQDVAADLELVIVDDASTDDSVQLIRALGDDRIRLLPNETNSGISKVRNQLLQAVRGDFITSLDGDDYYASNQKLSAELSLLMANDPQRCVAYSDIEMVDATSKSLARSSDISPPQEGILFQGMLDRRIMIPRDFLVARELAQSVGDFDESLSIYEDWDYKLRLAQQANFAYTGQIGIGYRRHGGGLSAAKGRVHRDHIARIRRKHGIQAMGGDPMNLVRIAGRVTGMISRKKSKAA